jgi:alpha-galactosidase
VYAVVAVATGVVSPPGRVRLPGLDPQTRYHVRALPPGDHPPAVGWPAWLGSDGIVLPGSVLGVAGIEVPAVWPEHLLLLEVSAA